MPTAAVIGGTSIGSALIGANAAQKAASQQARMFQQAQQQLQPFALPGQGAAAALAQLYGINPTTGTFDPNAAFNPASVDAFRRSPDYQFAFGEGLHALENSRAAQGALRGGNALRAITDYGQGLATQTFGNYRGALQQLAQLGAGAAGGVSQLMGQQGTALASGTIGAANAFTGALGSMGNYFMLQNLLRPQSAYGMPGSGAGPAAGMGSPGFGSPPAGFGPGQVYGTVPYAGF